LRRPQPPPCFCCAFLTLLKRSFEREHVLSAAGPPAGQLHRVMRAPLGLLAGCYALAQFCFTPLIGALSDRSAVNRDHRCRDRLGAGPGACSPSPCRSTWPAGASGRCRCCSPPACRWGERAAPPPPPGPCWPRHQPAQPRAPALSGDRCGLRLRSSSPSGGWAGFGGSTSSLPLLVAVERGRPQPGAGGEGCCRRPCPPAPAWLPRKREPSPPGAASSGCFGNPQGAALCAAFFLFFPGLRRLHRRAGALFQTGLAGPGLFGHRLL